jgi:hypothetical protein
MKKLLISLAVVAATVLFLAGLFVASAYVPPMPDQSGDYAFLIVLDAPFTPASISSQLYCPRQEARSGKLIMSSWWAKLASGKIIAAQVQSYNVGGGVGWAMLVVGPRHWARVMRDLVAPLNAIDAGAAKVSGPKDLSWLESKSATFCNKVARAFLIPLTGVLDGGALPRSPYTEGGSWPTTEIITCADGTKFELRTAMNGILLSREKWTAIPPTSAEAEAPAAPPSLLPCSTTWADPDAATTKSCGPVPIGTACP